MKTANNRPLYFGVIFMALFLAAIAIVRLNGNIDHSSELLFSTNELPVNGFFLPKSLPLAGVEFTSTDGSLISTHGFKNQWTLLALGYTQCPDVCPTTLMKLDHVISTIPEKNRPKVAFLSIDITPDNITQLNSYMNYFNEDFIGLSTTPEQLDEFFQSLGASYSIDKNASGGLDIEHSSAIYLISPDKKYVANFPYILSAEQISQDYLAIIRSDEY